MCELEKDKIKTSNYNPMVPGSFENVVRTVSINFKVKSIKSGYLVKLGCGREIVFKDKSSLIDSISAYINDPEKTEKEFKMDE